MKSRNTLTTCKALEGELGCVVLCYICCCHVGTKKVESASWVHFENLKGEFLKPLNFSLESLDSLLILLEINIMHF